ncbi:MAG: serine/threonine protein kinase [Deltaproteobacteria bacterium]|nr:serine/threonine protein kinase [Deltaproteobacteria bacterium]
MNLTVESLTLSNLQEEQTATLRKPTSTRPALYRIEVGNTRAVVKDFSVNGRVFRNLIGRFLIWRERKAYRRLKGVNGVPALYGVVEGLALVLEEIQGISIEGLDREKKLPPQFFESLRDLVERVHRRGLCHCDLKRAANVLVGNDEQPYIIDWSAAILKREFRFFPVSLIYKRFLLDDSHAVIKLQLRHCPEAIPPEALRQYRNRGAAERAIRKLRDGARDFLQKVA